MNPRAAHKPTLPHPSLLSGEGWDRTSPTFAAPPEQSTSHVIPNSKTRVSSRAKRSSAEPRDLLLSFSSPRAEGPAVAFAFAFRPWSLSPLVPVFLFPIPYSLLPAFMKPRPNPPV